MQEFRVSAPSHRINEATKNVRLKKKRARMYRAIFTATALLQDKNSGLFVLSRVSREGRGNVPFLAVLSHVLKIC